MRWLLIILCEVCRVVPGTPVRIASHTGDVKAARAGCVVFQRRAKCLLISKLTSFLFLNFFYSVILRQNLSER